MSRGPAYRAGPPPIALRLAFRAGPLLAALWLAGCATTSLPGDGWVRRDVTAGGRVLATATPQVQPAGDILTVVIEGDGLAHDSAGRPSADPTPRDPLGLRIAQAWPEGPRAWVARPCQYTRAVDPRCRPEDWTVDRFSRDALDAVDAAIDDLMAAAGARQVRLVGWSGGGVVAAALAGRRCDTAGLMTLAAPLDVAGWTRADGLSSLNLADEVRDLPLRVLPIPQVHLFGAKDRVTPQDTAMAVARTLSGSVRAVEVVAEPHGGAWDRRAAEAAGKLR